MVNRTRFLGGHNVSAASRAMAVDGVQELLSASPREVVFFLAYIRTLVHAVLVNDASPDQVSRHSVGYEGLLSAISLRDAEQLQGRLDLIKKTARDFRNVAERIMAENQGAQA